MSSVNPTSGSFSQYAHDAIGPWAGFTIGWLYWFFWVIVIAIEAIAGAGIIQYWFPGIPLWLTSLLLTVLLTLTNIYSVKSFGEFEYWLSLVKVATIVVFLIAGFAFIFGIVPGDKPVGLENLAGGGGFFPKGPSSVLLGIVVVIFSFMGSEIVAIAAGETSNPVESVTKATRSVVWRIIIFLRRFHCGCGHTVAVGFSQYFGKPLRCRFEPYRGSRGRSNHEFHRPDSRSVLPELRALYDVTDAVFTGRAK